MKHTQRIFLFLFLTSSLGCAARPVSSCGTPLTDKEITEIAGQFLQGQSMNPEFRKKAERRITPRGCNYEYEESEKLDSFGVGIVVVVDRNRKVVDFYSSE